MAEKEETSRQCFDKLITKCNYINATTADIMKCLEDPSPNLQDMNKEVKALLSDPMILSEAEADLNEVFRDFSGDPDMIAFKTKYQKFDQLLRDTMEDESK